MKTTLLLIYISWRVTTMKTILWMDIPSITQVTGIKPAFNFLILNSKSILYYFCLVGRSTKGEYFSALFFLLTSYLVRWRITQTKQNKNPQKTPTCPVKCLLVYCERNKTVVDETQNNSRALGLVLLI